MTNNDDTDKLGRVKVKYPTLSDSDESTWARVATPGGGVQRGLQWIPEVGDEVLVGFELGDKTRPMILGGLWSRKDKPPHRVAMAQRSVPPFEGLPARSQSTSRSLSRR